MVGQLQLGFGPKTDRTPVATPQFNHYRYLDVHFPVKYIELYIMYTLEMTKI
jgi:hypothetical protein